MPPDSNALETYDYIVVGSGAGGGPVAANLASAGFSVLLIEAGPDYDSLLIDVPAFHGLSTQDPNIRWDFWVRHYEDDARQKLDSKYYETFRYPGQANDEPVDGVLYPRCAALGGCTAHNAMITVYPHDSDWENLAQITSDPSWAPDKMRRYFERIERCDYIDPKAPDVAASRHGFRGWLGIGKADVNPALGDTQLLKIIVSAAAQTLWEVFVDRQGGDTLAALETFLEKNPEVMKLLSAPAPGGDAGQPPVVGALARVLDPNDYQITQERREGVFLVPLAVDAGARNGSRERVRRVRAAHPDKLTVRANALATKVLFEGNRAVGVEYMVGQRLYQAAIEPAGGRPAPGLPQQVRALREVILAGGTFNTPQLLLLSGIGPKADLDALGIPVRLDRPAVGRFLQDRYEVAVLSELPQDLVLFKGCTFRLPEQGEQPDPALAQWQRDRSGVYASNGAVVAIVRRSAPTSQTPTCSSLDYRPPSRAITRSMPTRLKRDETALRGPSSRLTRETQVAPSRCARPIPRSDQRSCSATSKKEATPKGTTSARSSKE